MDDPAQRSKMVERDIAGRGVRDEQVLAAMRIVPREHFVAERRRSRAYDDRPLPIGAGQTISQPYIVALMAETAGLSAEDKVLEIGTGSGYGAAVLAQLAAEVHTVERIPELAESARASLAPYGNVSVHLGDGTSGWPDAAPYDAIVVTAASPEMPPALVSQLAPGGRLVIPVGAQHGVQRLQCVERTEQGTHTRDLGAVAFVPLISDPPN